MAAESMTNDANALLMDGEPKKKAAPRKKDDFDGKAKAHQRYYVETGELDANGKPKKIMVPGATTVIGVLAKPYLVGWANALGLQGIDSNKHRDEAAAIGSLAHYLVECDLTGATPDLKHFTPYQLERAAFGFKNWQEWRAGKVIEPILTEGRLTSAQHRYGGTVDFYGKVDGLYTLLDFKTSESIYQEHLIQASSYAKLLIDGKYPLNRVYVIRLGRGASDTLEVHRLGREDMRRYWELFQACLTIYYLQKALRGKG